MVAGALLVFTITWWVAIFIALPINIEVDAQPQAGFASSAPKRAHLGVKVLIVTIISAIFSGLYCYLKYAGYLADLSFLYDLVP
ncbi:hypothetical protein U370_04405 [Anaplasma marginale str. Dawn]|uniref:DUF1467 family protein n=1 Tax=Anaplasma marginale TaxID=770 RepID=A0A643CM93_ANAMA|nr:DUF1467 family protein [Anaplasma marginale]AGZ79186.1 hypothetical protein U128_04595 [Anaplasma marginale str. Gypsy Plains]AGZ79981.1 hypothetical protein U370_04405 [Anaplasma marginale str. Dawn]AXW84389.1 DUF1467 domain-containing protein [Anaplasma marginale]AXW85318.1 DUF1467 domain-containing protein [Anaplasma marginale]KAA8472941.1 DUF1467 family protein [Anaplasma marginale]